MSERYLASHDDPIGIEWVAALYESYAADHEDNEQYAGTAMKLTEAIEYNVYNAEDIAAGYQEAQPY